jgi:hypothetical protein
LAWMDGRVVRGGRGHGVVRTVGRGRVAGAGSESGRTPLGGSAGRARWQGAPAGSAGKARRQGTRARAGGREPGQGPEAGNPGKVRRQGTRARPGGREPGQGPVAEGADKSRWQRTSPGGQGAGADPGDQEGCGGTRLREGVSREAASPRGWARTRLLPGRGPARSISGLRRGMRAATDDPQSGGRDPRRAFHVKRRRRPLDQRHTTGGIRRRALHREVPSCHGRISGCGSGGGPGPLDSGALQAPWSPPGGRGRPADPSTEAHPPPRPSWRDGEGRETGP